MNIDEAIAQIMNMYSGEHKNARIMYPEEMHELDVKIRGPVPPPPERWQKRFDAMLNPPRLGYPFRLDILDEPSMVIYTRDRVALVKEFLETKDHIVMFFRSGLLGSPKMGLEISSKITIGQSVRLLEELINLQLLLLTDKDGTFVIQFSSLSDSAVYLFRGAREWFTQTLSQLHQVLGAETDEFFTMHGEKAEESIYITHTHLIGWGAILVFQGFDEQKIKNKYFQIRFIRPIIKHWSGIPLDYLNDQYRPRNPSLRAGYLSLEKNTSYTRKIAIIYAQFLTARFEYNEMELEWSDTPFE